MKRIVFLLFCLAFFCTAQDAYFFPDIVKIVEKHNYSHSVNNSYVGHVYRELRGRLERNGASFSGSAYFLEALTHLAPSVPQRVDNAVRLSSNPASVNGSQDVFPTYKAVPFIPAEGIPEDEPWRGFGYVSVDPLGHGKWQNIQVLVEYTYAGKQLYNGEEVIAISGQFAMRYKAAGSGLVESHGKHILTIYINKAGFPLFIKDSFDDMFFYADGTQVKNRGFSLVWFYSVVPFDYQESVNLIASKLDEKNYEASSSDSKPERLSNKSKERCTFAVKMSSFCVFNKPFLCVLACFIVFFYVPLPMAM